MQTDFNITKFYCGQHRPGRIDAVCVSFCRIQNLTCNNKNKKTEKKQHLKHLNSIEACAQTALLYFSMFFTRRPILSRTMRNNMKISHNVSLPEIGNTVCPCRRHCIVFVYNVQSAHIPTSLIFCQCIFLLKPIERVYY